MTEKDTEQIIQEWRRIDERHPGGSRPHATQVLEAASTRDLTEQERRLIDVITVLHDTVQSYHEEMGTLIRDYRAVQGESAATLIKKLRSAAIHVLCRYDEGDLTVDPNANRFGRDRADLAVGELRAATADSPYIPDHLTI